MERSGADIKVGSVPKVFAETLFLRQSLSPCKGLKSNNVEMRGEFVMYIFMDLLL